VGWFPHVSETFVIDQVAHLLDRGVDVEIFAFHRGETEFVSRRFFDYRMAERVTYLDPPLSRTARVRGAWRPVRQLARHNARSVLRAVNGFRFGRRASSLRLLYWASEFVNRGFDVVHCHFGPFARDFVAIREVIGSGVPLVTTFYGYDVSKVFREQPPDYYDGLKQACSLYFVMSRDMKRRVVAVGFREELVQVLPVGIDVEDYPYHRRTLAAEHAELRIVAVGRFVEKKGFDDLLRAVAIVRKQSPRPVRCTVIGGGPLEVELRSLAESLGVADIVEFGGYMPVERVIELFGDMHVLVQPSKTAADGDME